jgi:hypothetical protein
MVSEMLNQASIVRNSSIAALFAGMLLIILSIFLILNVHNREFFEVLTSKKLLTQEELLIRLLA